MSPVKLNFLSIVFMFPPNPSCPISPHFSYLTPYPACIYIYIYIYIYILILAVVPVEPYNPPPVNSNSIAAKINRALGAITFLDLVFNR